MQLEGVAMGQNYHDGQRELQDRFDSRRLADRLSAPAIPQFDLRRT